MHIDVVTIFPDLIADALGYGILGRAAAGDLVNIAVYDLRDYCHDRHSQVDDTPYGGGPGMVMKPEPFFDAVSSLQAEADQPGHVILLSPQGRLFNQQIARQLTQQGRLILLCSRYEGIDERVREALADQELSIGDYVLSGAEFAALVVMDAVVRLVDGVLGNEASTLQESHAEGLLEYPQYTRPAVYQGMAVPELLVRGHHEEIRRWRRRQALKRTLERRPDLLSSADLTDEDWQILGEL